MTFAAMMREVRKITLRDGLPMSHPVGKCHICDGTRLRILRRVMRRPTSTRTPK